MIDLELSLCSDGAACLAYFDSIRGNDRVFIIKPDGSVFEQGWDGDQEVLTPVASLPAVLLQMAQQAAE